MLDVAVFSGLVDQMVWVKESPPMFKGSLWMVLAYEDGHEQRLIVGLRERFFVIEDYAHLGYVRFPVEASDIWIAELKNIMTPGLFKKTSVD